MGRGRRGCLIAAVILLLASLIPAYLRMKLREDFTEQTAAERWRGSSDARFGQVSCFLDESIGIPPEREYSIRENLETALAGKTEERWLMAMSGSVNVTIARDSAQLNVRGICTNGSFSHFHPMQMVSGSWFAQDEMNRDGVVLDMQLAWKLFGGYDLQGMTVSLNGIPVQIAVEPKATCIEAVLPDPVAGFALEQLKSAVGAVADSCAYVENTDRFSLLNSLEVFLHPDDRVMRTTRVTYPYWENAARVAESRCGIYAAVMFLLLVFPACVLLSWVYRGLAYIRRKGRELLKRRK